MSALPAIFRWLLLGLLWLGCAAVPARPANSTPPASAYLFTGQQFDPELGLYYLRARYHNPDSGRFWTADAFEGFASDPASLHRYTFNQNDPGNRFDPSGNMSLGESLTTTQIASLVGGVLNGMMGAYEAGRRSQGEAWSADTLGSQLVGFGVGALTGVAFGQVPAALWATQGGRLVLGAMTGAGLGTAINTSRQGGLTDLVVLETVFSVMPWALSSRQLTELMYWRFLQPSGVRAAQTLTPATRNTDVRMVNPAQLRWSQTTAGGGGRAATRRQSMAEHGWTGDPIDVVQTADGLATVDHTRAAVALEQGIAEIPVRVHAPDEPLPADMLTRGWNRAGDTAATWGEALRIRGAGQRPPIGPTGSPTPPTLPPRN